MSIRRVILPIDPDAPWDAFAWPTKSPGDIQDYVLECTAWLADAGATLLNVTVSASSDLQGSAVLFSGGTIGLKLSGGTPNGSSTVGFVLTLSGGKVLNVVVALPISAGIPPGLVPIQGGSPTGSGLTDDFGIGLTDDLGSHLLAA